MSKENCAGAMPRPEIAAATEPPGVPVTVRVAVLLPPEVGLNRAAMVQTPFGARTVPWQPLEPATIVNWDGSVPPSAVLSAPVAVPPVLVIVNRCDVLV